MTSENQQKILQAFSHFMADVCEAFDLDSFSYEKGVSALRTYGQWNVYDVLLAISKNALPSAVGEITLTREHFPQVLGIFESPQAAEFLLSQLPDEGVDRIDMILDDLSSLLPSLRRIMLTTAKRLPHDKGGRPQLFSAEERQDIRDEIGRILARGVSLKDAQARVALKKSASLSSIQRAWRELKKSRKTVHKRIK